MRKTAVVLGMLVAAGAACGQIVNGNFETGSLSPWVVGFTNNGTTLAQAVESFDIDGPGPLPPSKAAKFAVGNFAPPYQPNAGLLLHQPVPLSAGVAYTIRLDYAAMQLAGAPTPDGGQFAIMVDGSPLAAVLTGQASAGMARYGSMSAGFVPPTSRSYVIGVRVARDLQAAAGVLQYLDNITISSGPSPCYPDCNGDGVLNLADFGCFQTKFALGCP